MISDEVKKRVLVFDGAMGTMIFQKGVNKDVCPDYLNISTPELISEIHKLYFDAGSDVIETNTFGANRVKLQKYDYSHLVGEINKKGIEIAKKVCKDNCFVAQSVGPVGKIFKPAGDFDFDEAVDVFYEQVYEGIKNGADLISVETISDIKEAKAAFLAYLRAKDDLGIHIPILISMTFENNERTLMGTPPEVVAYVFSTMGADLVGANCSGGVELLYRIIKKMSSFSFSPLSVKPNAGLPQIVDGKTVYNQCVVDFVEYAHKFIDLGVRLYGGCCGTNPEYIKAISDIVKGYNILFNPTVKPEYITSIFECINIKNINNIAEIDIDNDYSEDMLYDYIGLDMDAILVNVKDITQEKLKDFLLNAQDFIKKPFIFNAKDKTFFEQIDKYYFGIYGYKEIGGNYGIKV